MVIPVTKKCWWELVAAQKPRPWERRVNIPAPCRARGLDVGELKTLRDHGACFCDGLPAETACIGRAVRLVDSGSTRAALHRT